MKTIVPTNCIVVAGQELHQWHKLYRNKINMLGQSWTEHVYQFTRVVDLLLESTPKRIGGLYEIRIYKNQYGSIIWANGPDSWSGNIAFNPRLSGGEPLYMKKSWKRSFTDVKFLLSFERTREDFIEGVERERKTWLLFPSIEVKSAVWHAISKKEEGKRVAIGSYSGPASLSIQELKALGVKVCHRPPTKKFPEIASGDHVSEGFNWGNQEPNINTWFKHRAGFIYNGSVGCNAGWVWYDER